MAWLEPPTETRSESELELLVGAELPLTARLRTWRRRLPKSRLGRSARRALTAVAAGAVALGAAIGLYVAHDPHDHAASTSPEIVVTGVRLLPPVEGWGVDTVLSVRNQAATAVTVSGVALGSPEDQGVAPAESSSLAIGPGEGRTLTVHSGFDCLVDHAAVAATVQFTVTAADGNPHVIRLALPPGSSDPSLGTLRDRACRVPYPLASADVAYSELAPTAAPDDRTFGTTFDLTLPDEGRQASAITVTEVHSDLHGTVSTLAAPIVVASGTTTALTLDWTITDCSAIPAYAGIPKIILTARNDRAVETRYYTLSARYAADLASELAKGCAGRLPVTLHRDDPHLTSGTGRMAG